MNKVNKTVSRSICLYCFCLLALLKGQTLHATELLVEAESFQNKGGWVVDQQFMDQMGSPYLMAHGMGKQVKNASTRIQIKKEGTYYVYVRTYNWTSPWFKGEGAGKFRVKINKKSLIPVGIEGNSWMWQSAGKLSLKEGEHTLALEDMSGFNGRCDAIYLTMEANKIPPSDITGLKYFRKKRLGMPTKPRNAGHYDLVVVGGGVAGLSAAIAAARLGSKVALIHNRPVLGGNNSSEVRVSATGHINVGKYKELGDLQNEFGPSEVGNAGPASNYADGKKDSIVATEKNISLFLNTHAIGITKQGNNIETVLTKNIETGEEFSFTSPLFADCTGDGNLGYMAGADFKMGREAREEFNESTAPEVADKMTMGASVMWYSKDLKKTSTFPLFKYGMTFDKNSCEKITRGDWTWETGMNKNQIDDFEYIRDYGMLVIYSNWSYLKNESKEKNKFQSKSLDWVAYVSGKRESRRLIGDYILKEDDIRRYIVHEDGSAAASWTIDLHYPDPQNTNHFPEKEFKSIAKHIAIYPYPIPYRCFYSRNINNLFMAGRNISVTHVALGSIRVMRTTGMIGEVVGMAASICKKHSLKPRAVYQYHLAELKKLMKEGVGRKDAPITQTKGKNGILKNKPEIRSSK